MDREKKPEPDTNLPTSSLQKQRPFVYTVRDWKEYLGESFLIVFSVLLALFLSEYFNKLHERQNTIKLLEDIRDELIHNKKGIKEMAVYNLNVLARIDSATSSPQLQSEILSHGDFHLKVFAPEGILYRYLDDVAWTIAKNNNIASKVDIETISEITKVYDDQEKMMRIEADIAKIIFDRASRDPMQLTITLKLIRDIYHGWSVDREPGLLADIDKAVKAIEQAAKKE
jgi:hypothetical protein